MSIKSAQKAQIAWTKAAKDGVIKKTEEPSLEKVMLTKAGKLDSDAAKVIGERFDVAVARQDHKTTASHVSSTGIRVMHNPPRRPAVKIEKGTMNALNAFFSKEKLPYGGNREAVVGQISFAFESTQHPALKKSEWPKNTEKLHRIDVELPGDKETTSTAYLDAKTQKFFVARNEGYPDESWFGPLQLGTLLAPKKS